MSPVGEDSGTANKKGDNEKPVPSGNGFKISSQSHRHQPADTSPGTSGAGRRRGLLRKNPLRAPGREPPLGRRACLPLRLAKPGEAWANVQLRNQEPKLPLDRQDVFGATTLTKLQLCN